MLSTTSLLEQILILIWKERKIEIEKIQVTFTITRETTSRIISFLLKYGFVEIDEKDGYIMVSEPCRRFFDEDVGREKAVGSLMVAFL
ncbi:MAG: putative DNA-binding transcriptional regulator [Candidatus Nitrosomirales archaeon]|jgi:predicted DNA-binding transcriptional regulator